MTHVNMAAGPSGSNSFDIASWLSLCHALRVGSYVFINKRRRRGDTFAYLHVIPVVPTDREPVRAPAVALHGPFGKALSTSIYGTLKGVDLLLEITQHALNARVNERPNPP